MRLDPGSVRAVLFDLDGVLIHSYDVWFRVMNAAARRFGAAPISRQAFQASWGQGVVADVERFFPMCEVEELSAFYDACFPEHLDALEVEIKAPEVFAVLRSAGLRIAVVSNTPSPLVSTLVEKARVEPDAVVGGNDVPRPKPAPDVLERACELLSVRAAACVVVGDSAYDRDAARAAAIPFVGLGLDGDARIEALDGLLPLLGLQPPSDSGGRSGGGQA